MLDRRNWPKPEWLRLSMRCRKSGGGEALAGAGRDSKSGAVRRRPVDNGDVRD